jgi:mono/diheme cytochrome c family protein
MEAAMRTPILAGTLAVAIGTILASGCAYAQGADIGKQEYRNSCASCHGDDAKGTGPIAGFLTKRVPDLTVLARNSGGVFPFARVYDVIDGRQSVAAHGPRDMQVWGNEYVEEGEKRSGGNALPEELNSYARGKIIALIGYLASLQEK